MQMIVGSELKGPSDGGWMDVLNPATLEVINRVPKANVEDVEQACAISAESQHLWSDLTFDQRKKVLAQIADDIKANMDDIAATITAEVGKPLGEAKHEALACASTFKFFSTLDVEEEVLNDTESVRLSVIHRPIGPCALILPWNFPFALMGWKSAPALLAGNPLVVKPAPTTPLGNMKLGNILADRLPKGIISVVTGADDVGKALVTSKHIRRVSFTGSVETGPKVLEGIAASGLKKVSLELGGNDAAIVAKDFDLSKVASLMWSSFRNAGQVCIAVKRVYVEEPLYEDLVKAYVASMDGIKVGNGAEAGVNMGPLNNLPQLKVVQNMVQDTKDNGGTIKFGGNTLMGQEGFPGYFHEPTVCTDVDESFSVVSNEQFGPIVPIVPVPSIDDALDRVNSSRFGLGGSVWTNDMELARRVSEHMQCGTSWINTHMIVEKNAPFGGVKASGIGRELGRWGFEEFTEPKTIYMKK